MSRGETCMTMALSRIIFGCLLLLFVGFIWIPIWIVNISENDVDIKVLDVGVADTRLLSTQGKRKHKLEFAEISKLLKTSRERKDKRYHGTTETVSRKRVETDKPVNVIDVSTTWINEEWLARASDAQHIITARSSHSNSDWKEQTSHTMLSTHRGTTTSTCNQMTYLHRTTFRWIKVVCEVFKRQPPIVRVGLLVIVVVTSLILTIVGYRLMCPRVHHREGIEKLYDMEDSWLMFA